MNFQFVLYPIPADEITEMTSTAVDVRKLWKEAESELVPPPTRTSSDSNKPIKLEESLPLGSRPRYSVRITRSWSINKEDFQESLEFVEEPPEDFKCPVCLSVVKEPHLTECCGHLFCQKCIDRVIKYKRPCPLCKEADFHTMLDKRTLRELRELKVLCVRSKHGCRWEGTVNDLQRHLYSDCKFEYAMCSNGCGERILRCNLKEHLTSTCPKCDVSCSYCQWKGTLDDLTNKHLDVCPRMTFPCRNGCGMPPIERHEMEKHITRDCPLQLVTCDFRHVGCTVQVTRKEIPQHIMENLQHHLSLMAMNLQDLHLENISLQQKIKQQELEEDHILKEVSSLMASIPLLPFEFTLPTYSKNKLGHIWFGPSFFTHYKGYKICPKLYPAGHVHGKPKWTHQFISFFFATVKGPYDDELEWPLRAEVTVQALNLRGTRHWERTMTISFNKNVRGYPCGQSGWTNFITHAEVESKKTNLRYLDENQLHFRVVSVVPVTAS